MTVTHQDPVKELAAWIEKRGPIQAVRVSSAGYARTPMGGFAYYGVARYQIIVRDGVPVARCITGAPRTRRSRRLAEMDAQQLCAREGCILIEARGPLSQEECAEILRQLMTRATSTKE